MIRWYLPVLLLDDCCNLKSQISNRCTCSWQQLLVMVCHFCISLKSEWVDACSVDLGASTMPLFSFSVMLLLVILLSPFFLFPRHTFIIARNRFGEHSNKETRWRAAFCRTFHKAGPAPGGPMRISIYGCCSDQPRGVRFCATLVLLSTHRFEVLK